MHIGVPAEIKTAERRVGLTPGSVNELVRRGHQVTVQSGAGHGIGADDATYQAAGADIAGDAASVFAAVDMVVKVKDEYGPDLSLSLTTYKPNIGCCKPCLLQSLPRLKASQ